MNKCYRLLLCATSVATALTLGACNKAPEPAATSPAVAMPAASTASATVGNVSDMDVTEHVKTALQQNDSLKAFNINVVTLNGDVRLIGMVDNQTQIDDAVRIARASDGAHSIHDELTLKK